MVISVPVYYTDAQRRLMLHAADIAGLKVLLMTKRVAHFLPPSPCCASQRGCLLQLTTSPGASPHQRNLCCSASVSPSSASSISHHKFSFSMCGVVLHSSMMILWLQPRASAKTNDAGMACQRAQTSLTTRQNPLLYVPNHSRAFSCGVTLRLRAIFRCDNAMLQVVFFDLGQSACSASAVQFTKSKLKVRGVCVLPCPGLSRL